MFIAAPLRVTGCRYFNPFDSGFTGLGRSAGHVLRLRFVVFPLQQNNNSNSVIMSALDLLYRRAGFMASLLVGVLGLSSPASSEEDRNQQASVALRGFGTLGIARSSSDQAEMVRDLSQPRGISKRWSGRSDSVFGLQANVQATGMLEAVAQLVSRYHSEGNFRPELTWAFLKYEPNAYLTLRAGRFGTEFFMRADSRLVGYSYLSVRPAPDFFATLPFSYIDGVDVLLTAPLADGLLRGKLYSGMTREKIPIAGEQLDVNGARMAGGYLEYQQNAWMWRASAGQIRFNHELPSPVDRLRDALVVASAATGISTAQAAADDLSLSGGVGRFYSVGAVYDNGPLQAHAMLSRILHDSVAFENSRSGMLIVGYRIGDVTPFTGYSWVKSESKQLNTGLPDVGALALINSSVAAVLADSHSDQNTTTLGLRWDFYRNTALKLQFDMVHGTPRSIFPYRRETADWNGRVNVFSMTMDFIF